MKGRIEKEYLKHPAAAQHLGIPGFAMQAVHIEMMAQYLSGNLYKT